MKTSARIPASIGSGIACMALVACGGGSDPNSPEYQAFVERDALMQDLGEAQELLNDMAAESIPVDEAAFRAAAQTVAQRASGMLGVFENQTIVVESRTKPEVFTNWADFTAKHGALVTAANALNEAASTGGFAAGRSLVAPLRETCGNCHRPYRGPVPE